MVLVTPLFILYLNFLLTQRFGVSPDLVLSFVERLLTNVYFEYAFSLWVHFLCSSHFILIRMYGVWVSLCDFQVKSIFLPPFKASQWDIKKRQFLRLPHFTPKMISQIPLLYLFQGLSNEKHTDHQLESFARLYFICYQHLWHVTL